MSLRGKICIASVLISIFNFVFIGEINCVAGQKGEKIIFTISPVGVAEYLDCGEVPRDGKKVNLVTFNTRVFGFKDTERIYYDPNTFLPTLVERDIEFITGKEYLTEEYDQKTFKLVIKKFKDNKEVKRYNYAADGPLHNAILMPFYLRTIPELEIGWTIAARFPDKFQIRLTSIEEIEIPAGKFQAYHFTSKPDKFEVWISRDKDRLPLKIRGMGGLGYSLVFKGRVKPGGE